MRVYRDKNLIQVINMIRNSYYHLWYPKLDPVEDPQDLTWFSVLNRIWQLPYDVRGKKITLCIVEKECSSELYHRPVCEDGNINDYINFHFW